MEILLSPKATNANHWTYRWRSFWQNLVYRGRLFVYFTFSIQSWKMENLEKESLKNLEFLNLKALMELIRYVRLVSSVLYR